MSCSCHVPADQVRQDLQRAAVELYVCQLLDDHEWVLSEMPAIQFMFRRFLRMCVVRSAQCAIDEPFYGAVYPHRYRSSKLSDVEPLISLSVYYASRKGNLCHRYNIPRSSYTLIHNFLAIAERKGIEFLRQIDVEHIPPLDLNL